MPYAKQMARRAIAKHICGSTEKSIILINFVPPRQLD